jgi:hypothetical protein
VTPEVWKTLISIFDVDPRTVREAGAQVTVIRDRYDRLRGDLAACDAKSAACDRQAGRGPGNAPCRNAAGVEMVVAEATIDRAGLITVTAGQHAREIEAKRPLAGEALGAPLSVEQFGSLFRPWRQHGLSQDPPCAYKAALTYDPRAPAGSYEPARRAIASYFTLTAPPRKF